MTDTEKNNAHSANVGNHTNKNSMCKYNILTTESNTETPPESPKTKDFEHINDPQFTLQAVTQQTEATPPEFWESLDPFQTVIDTLIAGGLCKLQELYGIKAASNTYIDNIHSAINKFIQDKEKTLKDINSFIESNSNNREFWFNFMQELHFEKLAAKKEQRPQEYAQAVERITLKVISISADILKFLLKYWTLPQIHNKEFERDFKLRTELLRLYEQTNYEGVITYFKCVTTYAVDGVTDTIFNVEKYQKTKGFEGSSLSKWKKDKTTTARMKLYYEKEGETFSKIIKVTKFAFDTDYCCIYKRYENGFRCMPYNPLTSNRDNTEEYQGLDFCNEYHPPFFTMPEVQPQYAEEVQIMYQQFKDIMMYLSGSEPKMVEFWFDYMAHLVQKPYEGVIYIVFFVSDEEVRGVGKGSVLSVIRKLAGETNCTQIQSGFINVFGKNNECLSNSIIQCKEELGNEGKPEYPLVAEQAKEFSGVTWLTIENKYKSSQKKRVFTRFVFNTNHKSEVVIDGSGDRRTVIFTVTDSNPDTVRKMQKIAENFRDKLENKQVGKEFIKFLTLELLKRNIIPNFNQAFNNYPILREQILKYSTATISTKSDVCLVVLYNLCMEIQRIREFKQRRLGDTLENSKKYKDLINGLEDKINTFVSNGHRELHIEFLSLTNEAQDMRSYAMTIANLYIRHQLELMNSYAPSLKLAYQYNGYNKRVPKEENKVYSYFWAEFANKYPDILKITKPSTKGCVYRLSKKWIEQVQEAYYREYPEEQ